MVCVCERDRDLGVGSTSSLSVCVCVCVCVFVFILCSVCVCVFCAETGTNKGVFMSFIVCDFFILENSTQLNSKLNSIQLNSTHIKLNSCNLFCFPGM